VRLGDDAGHAEAAVHAALLVVVDEEEGHLLRQPRGGGRFLGALGRRLRRRGRGRVKERQVPRDPRVRGAVAVVPPRSNRLVQRLCDFALYCERNLVERFFNKIKHYRAVATRYAKRARNYMAFVALVSVMLWIK
jgi:transposase